MVLRKSKWLRQRSPTFLFTDVMVAGLMTFQGWAILPVQSNAPEATVRKEASMTWSSDQKSHEKSRPPIPETVGATSSPFKLGDTPTTVSFDIHIATGPGFLRQDGQAKRVLLRVENAKSSRVPPPFDVYLNVPPGEAPEKHPELFAFSMSTFGMLEASQSKGDHPGNGLSDLQDITDLVVRLTASKAWDGKNLRVTFVPAPWKGTVDVKVSRVSLVIE